MKPYHARIRAHCPRQLRCGGTGAQYPVRRGEGRRLQAPLRRHTAADWRGFRQKTLPSRVDRRRRNAGPVGGNGEPSGGDIVTREEYGNFELRLQWRIAKDGNSGIMYRVSEEYEAPYESGPEMQVLDDAGHADGKSRLTAAGSCFGLYPAPAGIVKPAGEWNDVRIIANGPHVEHWLNGDEGGGVRALERRLEGAGARVQVQAVARLRHERRRGTSRCRITGTR